MRRELSIPTSVSVDLEAYINSFDSFATVKEPERKLITDLLRAPADFYNSDEDLLLEMLAAIKEWNTKKNYEYLLEKLGLKKEISAYNSYEKCLKCREFDASLNEIKIPKTYFYIGILFMVALCVFLTLLFVQIFYKMQIIPLHFLLMFCIASGGMFATVVAASIEWKRLKEGKRNRQRK